MSKVRKLPKFKNEAEEREFWESNGSREFVDWNQAKSVSFSNLKPSTKTISLRLPEGLLDRIEGYALPISYQGLVYGRCFGQPELR